MFRESPVSLWNKKNIISIIKSPEYSRTVTMQLFTSSFLCNLSALHRSDRQSDSREVNASLAWRGRRFDGIHIIFTNLDYKAAKWEKKLLKSAAQAVVEDGLRLRGLSESDGISHLSCTSVRKSEAKWLHQNTRMGRVQTILHTSAWLRGRIKSQRTKRKVARKHCIMHNAKCHWSMCTVTYYWWTIMWLVMLPIYILF